MKSKTSIRILVLAAVTAWPGWELYQLKVAEDQLLASLELRDSVETKLSAARVKYARANPF